jgi:hypothetical protein
MLTKAGRWCELPPARASILVGGFSPASLPFASLRATNTRQPLIVATMTLRVVDKRTTFVRHFDLCVPK